MAGKKIVRLVCCATIRLNGGAWWKWYDVQDEGVHLARAKQLGSKLNCSLCQSESKLKESC
jgi:cytochrome c-type biogenesis protein CcmH/NrfF